MRSNFGLARGGFLFVVFCLFSSANPLHAQWVQANGPYGGYGHHFCRLWLESLCRDLMGATVVRKPKSVL